MEQVAVGLVGYGLAGSVFHAPLIQAESRLRLKAVATSRVAQVAAELPGVAAVPSIDALLADPEIGLIVVASPNATHFPLAAAALDADRHVVVDKPFANSAAEADRLIERASLRGRLLSVFQNRRWDGDFLTVRQCLTEGRLGRVYHYESHFDRFRPQIKAGWREQPTPGSGILYDLGAHLIDQTLALFGLPEAVTAQIDQQRPEAHTVDYFHLVLQYGPMRAVLHSSTLFCDPPPRFSVHGDAGSFQKYGLDPQEGQLKAGLGPGQPGWGADAAEAHGVLTTVEGGRSRLATLPGSYQSYYAGIAAAILDDAPLPVDPTASRDGLTIIEAARRSALERRTVAVL